MGSHAATDLGLGASALYGMLSELAAADDLITELVTENEELRSRLASLECDRKQNPATTRAANP